MIRAKEGSRTPTRVTPLEPERTAFDRIHRETCSVVVSGQRQKRPGNAVRRQNSGACTTCPITGFHSARLNTSER